MGQNKTYRYARAGCKAEFYWRAASNTTAMTVLLQGAMTSSGLSKFSECSKKMSVWSHDAQTLVYAFGRTAKMGRHHARKKIKRKNKQTNKRKQNKRKNKRKKKRKKKRK